MKYILFVLFLFFGGQISAQGKFNPNGSFRYFSLPDYLNYISQSPVQVLDSITFLWVDPAYENLRGTFYYDEKGRLLKMEEKESPTHIKRYNFTYNENGQLTHELHQLYSTFNGELGWRNKNKKEIIYNEDGQYRQMNQKRWNPDLNNWEPAEQIDYVYDSQNQLEKATRAKWTSDGIHFISSIYDFYWNEQGSLDQEIYTSTSCSVCPLRTYWRYYYLYHANGELYQERFEPWSSDLEQFVLSWYDEYLYDSDKRLESKTNYTNYFGNIFVLDKLVYSYENNDRKVYEVKEEFNYHLDNWIVWERHVYYYNNNDQLYQKDFDIYSHALKKWITRISSDYAYNLRKNRTQLMYSYFTWEEGVKANNGYNYYWSIRLCDTPENEVDCVIPNPFTSENFIDCVNIPDGEFTSFKIYDLLGRQIYIQNNLSEGSIFVDETLPFGIYIFTIQTQNQILFSKKILVGQ